MSSVSDSCEWHIPISIATSDKPGEAAVKTLLEKKSCSVLMNGVQPDQWLKVSTIRLLCSEIDWERKSKRKTSCPSSVANLLSCWQLVFALTVGESRASWILPCSLQFRYAGAPCTGHQWPQVTSERSSGTWKWPLRPGKLANQHSKSLLAQPISTRKAQSSKNGHKPLRTSWVSPKTCPPCLTIIQSCYFDYRISKSFACSRCVIPLRDLCFVLCSVYLDVLRAQRIMGFFILITHKSARSEIRPHVRLFAVHQVLAFMPQFDTSLTRQTLSRSSFRLLLPRGLMASF